MACFLVSAAEAVVATAIEKAEEKKELKMAETNTEITEEVTIPWSRKLQWLTYMLWGGTILLAFEHIWHGEVVPWFPFLTAMSNPADAAEMFHEMATVGVVMAILITVVWIGMCAAADAIMKRPAKAGAPIALENSLAGLCPYCLAEVTVFEYAELGAEYFTPAAGDMLNDAFLGLSVVALGLVIWIVRLLITDPKGSVQEALRKKKA